MALSSGLFSCCCGELNCGQKQKKTSRRTQIIEVLTRLFTILSFLSFYFRIISQKVEK
jgi:hypothetical protein